jgi:UDP-N-acetylglucosamine:LPS N-acetylglucosamine transferase
MASLKITLDNWDKSDVELFTKIEEHITREIKTWRKLILIAASQCIKEIEQSLPLILKDQWLSEKYNVPFYSSLNEYSSFYDLTSDKKVLAHKQIKKVLDDINSYYQWHQIVISNDGMISIKEK